ncbi:MAG TPA: acetate--CoA ligase family protein [Pseudolysinimonas sp.]|nr:acetate--CoA ligase family protein [Pseudolysinimonas sp.]
MTALFDDPEGLRAFLHPRAVALVGGSEKPDAISARPARYLDRLGYSGDVVAIPDDGQGSVARALASLETTPDVALVLVAAGRVVDVLAEVAEAGVTRAIVIASGFEGELGAERRERLTALLATHPELRVIGPNCNGVLSVADHAALCFSSVLLTEDPREGSFSFVTQSGAIGNGILLALQARELGLAHWFSTGDELSIGALELTTALLDEDSKGVALFLEGLTDARHLEALAAGIARTRKPVLALRAPQSEESRLAALAHTGRMLGDDHIGRQSLLDAGVHLVDSIEELTDVVTVLSALPVRTATQEPCRVAVVTVSGGLGVFAAEAIAREPGLQLAVFDDETRARLAARLPAYLQIGDPLDIPVLGDTALFVDAITILRESDCCDVVVAVVSTLAHDYDLVAAMPAGNPVVLTHLSPEERFSRPQLRRLAEACAASVPSPVVACRALSIWASGSGESAAVESPSAASGHSNTTQLGLIGSAGRLGDGFARYLPPMSPIRTEEELRTAADAVPGRFVVKAEGSVLAHRTEYGAVAIGLSADRPEEYLEAFRAIEAISAEHGDTVVLQQMSAPGLEVLVSAVRDRELGPTVLLRAGGTLADLVDETVVLTGAVDTWSAVIGRSERLGKLLGGYRGEARRDLAALVELASQVRSAMVADDAIQVIECNPVLVHEEGKSVTIVDVLTWVTS